MARATASNCFAARPFDFGPYEQDPRALAAVLGPGRGLPSSLRSRGPGRAAGLHKQADTIVLLSEHDAYAVAKSQACSPGVSVVVGRHLGLRGLADLKLASRVPPVFAQEEVETTLSQASSSVRPYFDPPARDQHSAQLAEFHKKLLATRRLG